MLKLKREFEENFVFSEFKEFLKLIHSARRRKIIIHVPVKVKQQKHTHTLVKPVHVHHKPTVIKEEKVIKTEIHRPVHHTKEIHKPAEIHHEIYKPEIKEYHKPSPIYKEEISHEHLHHHYKVRSAC